MTNEIRIWYDFADMIGCFNYMFGMLRYSAKQTLNENNEPLNINNSIFNDPKFNAGLSMVCSIQ